MSIIVGTDFSANARQASDVAAAIARKLGTGLKLVHVVEPLLTTGLSSADRRVLMQPLEVELEAMASQLRTGGLRVEPLLLDGAPDEVLAGLAEREGAELVVAGALGQRARGWLRLGHVSERIAEMLSSPFLIVRDPAPFLAWTRGERPLKVVVGDDLSRFSEAAVRWLSVLRRIGPVEPEVVHIYWPFAEYNRFGLYGIGEGPADVEPRLLNELRKRMDALGESAAKVSTTLCMGKVTDTLLEQAVQDRADLVVLGAHQRRSPGQLWHGSVTHGVLHQSPVSVASIPMQEQAAQMAAQVPEISSVVVTTDFSELGNAAVPHAYSLLPKGGKVTLIHVIQTAIPLVYGEPLPVSGTFLPNEQERAAMQRRLEALIPAVGAERGVKTRAEIVLGLSVPRAIVQTAERDSADVICIGSHGHSGFKGLLLGSVARSVLAASRLPVFIVRPNQTR